MNSEHEELQREVFSLINWIAAMRKRIEQLQQPALLKPADHSLKQAIKDLQRVAERLAALEDKKVSTP